MCAYMYVLFPKYINNDKSKKIMRNISKLIDSDIIIDKYDDYDIYYFDKCFNIYDESVEQLNKLIFNVIVDNSICEGKIRCSYNETLYTGNNPKYQSILFNYERPENRLRKEVKIIKIQNHSSRFYKLICRNKLNEEIKLLCDTEHFEEFKQTIPKPGNFRLTCDTEHFEEFKRTIPKPGNFRLVCHAKTPEIVYLYYNQREIQKIRNGMIEDMNFKISNITLFIDKKNCISYSEKIQKYLLKHVIYINENLPKLNDTDFFELFDDNLKYINNYEFLNYDLTDLHFMGDFNVCSILLYIKNKYLFTKDSFKVKDKYTIINENLKVKENIIDTVRFSLLCDKHTFISEIKIDKIIKYILNNHPEISKYLIPMN